MNPPRSSVWITTVLFLFFSQISLAQTTSDVPPLELGKPIERELKGGETHTFTVDLSAGQFLRVVVDQRGIDVVVTLFGPDEKQIEQVDSPNGAYGPEPLTLLVKVSGRYRIEVGSLEKTTRPGLYEARIETLREATADDKKSERIKTLAQALAAVKTEDDGIALLARENELVSSELWKRLDLLGDSPNGPVILTNRVALRIAEQIGYKLGIATSLNNLGVAYRRQSDLKQAFDSFQKSLPLAEQLEDKGLLATVILNIGGIYQAEGNNEQALDSFQKVLKLSDVSKGTGVVTALNNMAVIFRDQGKFAEALDALQQVLVKREALGDKPGTVRAMLDIGAANQSLGNLEPALEYRQKALTLSESLKDKGLIAQTLLNLGGLFRVQSDYAKSLEYFQRELKLREELGDKSRIAQALNNIGYDYRFLGHLDEALVCYGRALKLAEEMQNKGLLADDLGLIGEIHRLRGNYAAALENYRRALELYGALKAKRGIANTLHGIGIILEEQGDHARALDYFQQDLKLREELGVKGPIADTLNTIGVTYYAWKNYAMATDYMQKSLQVTEQIGNKRGMAIALGNLGEIRRDQKDYSGAADYFARMLKLAESMGDKEMLASVLGDIGEISRLQGRLADSLDFNKRAVALSKEIGEPILFWNASLNAGKAYRDSKESAEARQAFEEAISQIESIRLNIASQEARSTFLAAAREPYELDIDLLMELHKQRPSEAFDSAALKISERARARSLLETLSEAHADIRQGIDSDLLERERVVSQQLNAAVDREVRLLSGKHTDDQAAAIKKDVDDVTAKFQDVEAEIRLKSPRYAALTQPTPLGLKEIQVLLDSETLILEYSLGEERSYLWVIGQSSLDSLELPKRSEIENAVAQFLRQYKSRPSANSGESRMESSEAAATLSRMLIAPAASLFAHKRLVIVADGALQFVPYAALRTAFNASPKKTGRLLILDHEIVNVPSASILSVLRKESRQSTAKTIAVFADPVFSKDDERVAKPGNAASSNGSSVPKSEDVDERRELEHPIESAAELGLNIRRLPGTRREADEILSLVPAGSGMKAVDFDASRETINGTELSHYRYIHFATHGFLNTQNPELSGIILSMVDRQGRPQNGFLLASDVFNLRLPAEVVVLSACQTGLGKEIRGEGLVGLTRGFMYAGSPRVIVSLWSVSDRATSQLMSDLYRRMLREHQRPAAALRAAQLEMLKQKRWQSPYFWAPFVIEGEWR